MRKLFTLLSGIFLLNLAISAQKITGVVKDEQGKGLAKTTISLIKSADSSVAKFTVTDNEGKFSMEALPGRYMINITHIGYAPFYTNAFEVTGTGDVVLGDLSLSKAETSLQGVVVSSKKPLVEVKADRMIVNVEGTINATGNDALELLRKSPGVMVDKDDNISLSGKTGVQIFIDGKPGSLCRHQIWPTIYGHFNRCRFESIELITNPSAKYEAAGNAGIIDIRCKKE